MKKTFFVFAAGMLLAGGAALFADEAMLIDFTALDADVVADENGNPTQNGRTVMDFAASAGTTFTAEQRALMKTSLALPEWEIELNSSARNAENVGLSTVVAAPVRNSADVPFAGRNVMGVRVHFPTWASNANARIVPPFEIPAFEPLATADANGDRQPQTDEEAASGRTLFESDDPTDPQSPAYGIVKNVGTIKSISVTTLGMNHPEGLYVLLKDNDDVERRYFMGYLNFDGWREMRWNNPEYIQDVRKREIRVTPIYPQSGGVPYVKFVGFLITRDAADAGGDYIGYFKDVKIIYDRALLTTERDIADEDLWGIVADRERRRQALEMERFGDKQVNRYIERATQAMETEFTSSLTQSENAN